MSFRGFGGIQTLPATAVPVYGTTLTAAPVINPDQFTGSIKAGNNRSTSVLSVANAVPFRVGDKVAVGTAAQFEQGNSIQADGGTVIAVGSGTITVQGLQRQHASGEFVVLALTCAFVGLQVLGASSTSIYVAEDGTAGPTSPTLLFELSAAGTYQFGSSNIANAFDTQKLWIQGGAGSQFIPSLITV
jgi:hypothetical protein